MRHAAQLRLQAGRIGLCGAADTTAERGHSRATPPPLWITLTCAVVSPQGLTAWRRGGDNLKTLTRGDPATKGDPGTSTLRSVGEPFLPTRGRRTVILQRHVLSL